MVKDWYCRYMWLKLNREIDTPYNQQHRDWYTLQPTAERLIHLITNSREIDTPYNQQWVSDWLMFKDKWVLLQSSQEQVTYWWVDDIHFVLDHHVKISFHSVSSMKQQSTGKTCCSNQIHYISWFWAKLSLFLLLILHA